MSFADSHSQVGYVEPLKMIPDSKSTNLKLLSFIGIATLVNDEGLRAAPECGADRQES
jgi:hypothetical protein